MKVSIELTRADAYVRLPFNEELNAELKRLKARFDRQGSDRAWILAERHAEGFADFAERQGHEVEWQ